MPSSRYPPHSGHNTTPHSLPPHPPIALTPIRVLVARRPVSWPGTRLSEPSRPRSTENAMGDISPIVAVVSNLMTSTTPNHPHSAPIYPSATGVAATAGDWAELASMRPIFGQNCIFCIPASDGWGVLPRPMAPPYPKINAHNNQSAVESGCRRWRTGGDDLIGPISNNSHDFEVKKCAVGGVEMERERPITTQQSTPPSKFAEG